MEKEDFTTTILVNATPQQAFNAITNVRGWWSENIEGDTDQLNSEFSYHYQDVHRSKIKITELAPGKRIVWHVLDNYFKFTTDKTEWKNTRILFEISEKEGTTAVTFTHQGLVPAYECFQVCHDAWTHYIQKSLKELIETGKGKPTPKETEEADVQPLPDSPDLKSICHRLLIEAPAETVYEALTTEKGLSGWWTPETKAKPETGSIARFAFGPDYFKEMEIKVLKPYSKIQWLCLKAFEEWVGTTLTFELEPHKKGTVLNFHHDGWKACTPEFASCTYDWGLFFRSLKFLCETGKGFPYPDFNK